MIKQKNRVPIIFGILLCVCMFNYLHAENFLKNPSFEVRNIRKPDQPQWWDRLCTLKKEQPLLYTDKKAFDGKYSICFQTTRTPAAGELIIWRHPALGTALNAVPEGTMMELSMYAYSDKRLHCTIYFPYRGISKEVTTTGFTTPGKWKKFKVNFKRENAPVGNIYIRMYGAGTIYVDKVYLGKAPLEKSGFPSKAPEKEVKHPLARNWQAKGEGNGNICRVVTPGLTGKRGFFISAAKDGSTVAWIGTFPGSVFGKTVQGKEYAVVIPANTHGIAATCFHISARITFKSGKTVSFSSRPISIYQGTEKCFLKFKMPEGTPESVQISVFPGTEGQLTFDEPEFLPAEKITSTGLFANKNNEFCRILNQPIRRNWKKSKLPRKMQFACHLPESDLKITLVDILSDKTISSWNKKLIAKKDTSFHLELPELALGSYEFIFESGKGPAALKEYDYIRVVPDDFSPRITFRDDNTFMIDGKPFFPLGPTHTPRTPEAFRINALSGTTMMNVEAGEDAGEWRYLNDMAKQYGIYLTWWNHFIYTGQYDQKRIESTLEKQAFILDGMKQVLGFMDDESAWCGVSSEWMRNVSRMYFSLFPDHLTWENHAPVMHGPASDFRRAPHNIRRFSGFVDVSSVDIYPVPDGRASYADLPSENRTLACVGEFVDACRKSSWNERPVMMILQNWALSESGGKPVNATRPRPEYHELRFMAWNAITHGANGILWHGEGNASNYGGNADFYSSYRQKFADVNKEITAVMKQYMALYKGDISPGKQHSMIRCIARSNGKTAVVIAVNEDRFKSHDFVMPLAGKFYLSPTGKELKQKTISLKPYEVLIATTQKTVIPPTPRFTKENPQSEIPCPYQSFLIPANWSSHPEYPRTNGKKEFYFKQKFTIPANTRKTVIQICGDDFWSLKAGNISVKGKDHTSVYEIDVTQALASGEHTLSGILENANGTTGIVFAVVCDGKPVAVSGKNTLFSTDGKNWKKGLERGFPPVGPWGTPSRFIQK